MLRKAWFWIAVVVLSLMATAFAVVGFPRAFPLLSLDVRMTRERALDQAAELAQRHGWGPEGFRHAASFSLDSGVQAFVELEAGGADGFRELIAGGLFAPYTWRVRHFAEGETTETLVRFTPAGEPYGFRERLPEDAPGAALSQPEAQVVAERSAAAWGLDLRPYDLVEHSSDVRPGDRVDHRLVYERRDETLGEGRYRLRLGVSGDRFTEITHFVDVPEGFARRHEDMRSSNEAIALVAGLFVFVVILLGVGGVSFFLLVRQRWLLWRRALLAGFLVSGLQAADALNQWPLIWMSYDTARSSASFVLEQALLVLGLFAGMGALFSFTFMVAESLTRRAFPQHVQLWRTWSRDAAASPTVVGQTAVGYLLVGLFFAYEVALYFLTTSQFGWWTPSGVLSEPNVLAHHLPWLTPLAISTQAGFWEECTFRAIPIAAAALVGDRLGGRRWLIAIAVVLQAVVFGAGHANYPAQPAYARLVELIVPSLGFALLYLTFGLLPAVVLHFAFDVVWMAMPLFTTSGEGSRLDQVLVVVLTLVPLWMVVAARLRTGRWAEVPEPLKNGGWTPRPAPPPRVEDVPAPREPLRRSRILGAIAAGVVGAALVASLGAWGVLSPSLRVTRDEALAVGSAALQDGGADLGEPWRVLATVDDGLREAHRFAWREGGSEAFRTLRDRGYLGGPRWRLRVARFEGDVADRAEEWGVSVHPSGRAGRPWHDLPEARPGERLPRAGALALAVAALRDRYELEAHELELVTADPSHLPNRDDWRFTWADRRDHPLASGEARVTVRIAGDEVVGSSRWLHVPEDWSRRERERRAVLDVLVVVGASLLGILVAIAAVAALVAWARGRFDARTAGLAAVVAGAVGTASAWNAWPSTVAQFSTAQPWDLQVGLGVLAAGVGVLLQALLVGLLVGFVQRWAAPVVSPEGGPASFVAGLGVGAAVAGLLAVVHVVAPRPGPSWGDITAAGMRFPWLAEALGAVPGFLVLGAIAVFAVATCERLTAAWTRRRLLVGLPLVVGLALLGPLLGGWTIPGAAVSAGLALTAGLLALAAVLRHDAALAVPAVAALLAQGLARVAVGAAHPGALPGAAGGLVLLVALAAVWSARLRSAARRGHLPADAPGGSATPRDG